MDDRKATSIGPRVVVFSRDESLYAAAKQKLPAVRWVRAPGAYEAAAELMSAPALALVLDLRAMSLRHLRLLGIAREMDVEILALGMLPAGLNTELLSGVRFVSSADLPAAVGKLVLEQHLTHPAASQTPAPQSSAQPEPEEEVEPSDQETIEPPQTAAPNIRLTPAKSPEDSEQNDQRIKPSELLTSEELAALLENEP